MTTRYALASASGDVFGMLLQTGYDIDLGRWRLTPLAGLRYVFDSSDSANGRRCDNLRLDRRETHPHVAEQPPWDATWLIR